MPPVGRRPFPRRRRRLLEGSDANVPFRPPFPRAADEPVETDVVHQRRWHHRVVRDRVRPLPEPLGHIRIPVTNGNGQGQSVVRTGCEEAGHAAGGVAIDHHDFTDLQCPSQSGSRELLSIPAAVASTTNEDKAPESQWRSVCVAECVWHSATQMTATVNDQGGARRKSQCCG